MSVYDFVMTDAEGAEVDFNVYRGKVLLIVDTEENDEHSDQYAGLEELYEKYKDRGFEVLDFPRPAAKEEGPEPAEQPEAEAAGQNVPEILEKTESDDLSTAAAEQAEAQDAAAAEQAAVSAEQGVPESEEEPEAAEQAAEPEVPQPCREYVRRPFKRFAETAADGRDIAPLFRYLRNHKGGLFGTRIKYCFTKFLIDREGNVVERYSPSVAPDNIEARIQDLLKQK